MNELAYMLNLPNTVSVALAVIANKYGVGQERIDGLTKDGYDAVKVQKCVNDLIKLFDKYGD